MTKIQPLFHVGDTLYLWESYPQKADTLDETGQNPGLSALYTGLCCQDSAMMVFDGKVVNKPYKDGRSCSDIVYVGEGE